MNGADVAGIEVLNIRGANGAAQTNTVLGSTLSGVTNINSDRGAAALVAGTAVDALTAGIQVVTPANGTTLTADLGITGGDVDQFVDGGNLRAAAGTYCATPVTAQHHLFTAADSIDVLLLTLTGTVSTGKFRVWALVASVSAL
jgi:hypothetical protein